MILLNTYNIFKAEILYMSALHGRLSGAPGEEVLATLNEAVDTHFKAVRYRGGGPGYSQRGRGHSLQGVQVQGEEVLATFNEDMNTHF